MFLFDGGVVYVEIKIVDFYIMFFDNCFDV